MQCRESNFGRWLTLGVSGWLWMGLGGQAYAQCNPLEVSLYMSHVDGWMFPYSAFYWGMSDGVTELSQTNPDCAALLEDNQACIYECLYMTPEEVDVNLGRVGCLFYTCPDGEQLVHNYEELTDRPVHLYGQYYCAEGTQWDPVLDLCLPNACPGDVDGDGDKDVVDVVALVSDILGETQSCE